VYKIQHDIKVVDDGNLSNNVLKITVGENNGCDGYAREYKALMSPLRRAGPPRPLSEHSLLMTPASVYSSGVSPMMYWIVDISESTMCKLRLMVTVRSSGLRPRSSKNR